jgi:hypothetical protein
MWRTGLYRVRSSRTRQLLVITWCSSDAWRGVGSPWGGGGSAHSTLFSVYCNTLSGRFRDLADSGLLHGKQFRVGFGQSWVHTRLEGGEGGAPAAAGLVSLATILQRPDPEVLFSIQNWLQVSNNAFLIRITKTWSHRADLCGSGSESLLGGRQNCCYSGNFFPASGSGFPNLDPIFF